MFWILGVFIGIALFGQSKKLIEAPTANRTPYLQLWLSSETLDREAIRANAVSVDTLVEFQQASASVVTIAGYAPFARNAGTVALFLTAAWASFFEPAAETSPI